LTIKTITSATIMNVMTLLAKSPTANGPAMRVLMLVPGGKA
jgi:hypothetical protein